MQDSDEGGFGCFFVVMNFCFSTSSRDYKNLSSPTNAIHRDRIELFSVPSHALHQSHAHLITMVLAPTPLQPRDRYSRDTPRPFKKPPARSSKGFADNPGSLAAKSRK